MFRVWFSLSQTCFLKSTRSLPYLAGKTRPWFPLVPWTTQGWASSWHIHLRFTPDVWWLFPSIIPLLWTVILRKKHIALLIKPPSVSYLNRCWWYRIPQVRLLLSRLLQLRFVAFCQGNLSKRRDLVNFEGQHEGLTGLITEIYRRLMVNISHTGHVWGNWMETWVFF